MVRTLFRSEARGPFEAYIKETIFYHYDGWTDDPLDEHSAHPSLHPLSLALTSLRNVGAAHVQLLRSQDLMGTTIEVPVDKRLQSDEIVSFIENQAESHEVRKRVSLFYNADDSLDFAALGLRQSPELHLFRQWNNRQSSRKLIDNLGVPQPRGCAVSSIDDVNEFVSNVNGPWIAKTYDRHPMRIETTDEVLKIFSPWPEGDWTIEEHVATGIITVTPNLTWLVSEEIDPKPIFMFASDQLLSPGSLNHCGNRFPSTLSEDLIQKCADIAAPILSSLLRIDSVVGIDFVFNQDDEPLVVDVNPRFNSSTFPAFAAASLVPQNNRVVHYVSVPAQRWQDLSSAVEVPEVAEILFKSDTATGVVLFAPQGVERLTAFRALSIGVSDEQCQSQIDALSNAASEG